MRGTRIVDTFLKSVGILIMAFAILHLLFVGVGDLQTILMKYEGPALRQKLVFVLAWSAFSEGLPFVIGFYMYKAGRRTDRNAGELGGCAGAELND